jgi:NADH-quinone oxidoreductase subunit N
MIDTLRDFIPFIPEFIIAIAAFISLVLGLYGNISKAIWWIGSIFLILSIYLLIKFPIFISNKIVLGGLANDHVSIWIKVILLFFAILIAFFHGGMSRVRIWHHGHHEFIVLMLLATVGAMFAVSARNFLILFVSIELVSLVSYIIAAYDRDNKFSSEAGMKYFILGSLASCIMIFGLSYIYGFSGSLSFSGVNFILAKNVHSTGLIAGLAIFLCGIFFKLSIVPFHFWTPDIYQGSPFISVAFLTSIPKFTFVVVLVNLVNLVMMDIKSLWQNLFIILALSTILVGALGAIVQKSLKRLMGYSAVLNLGFVLLAISTGTSKGFAAAIIYQLIYSLSSIGLFATLAITIFPDAEDYLISNLSGFGIVKKLAAFSMSVFMFSMAGIPPLAGFFAKFYIISALINQFQYVALIIALLSSVIAAFYYINIVRTMYFIQPQDRTLRLHESSALAFVISISTGFVLLFPFLQHLM